MVCLILRIRTKWIQHSFNKLKLSKKTKDSNYKRVYKLYFLELKILLLIYRFSPRYLFLIMIMIFFTIWVNETWIGFIKRKPTTLSIEWRQYYFLVKNPRIGMSKSLLPVHKIEKVSPFLIALKTFSKILSKAMSYHFSCHRIIHSSNQIHHYPSFL